MITFPALHSPDPVTPGLMIMLRQHYAPGISAGLVGPDGVFPDASIYIRNFLDPPGPNDYNVRD